MTGKPILFSAPMIRALLEGRKTQTRRILKPKNYNTHLQCDGRGDWWWWTPETAVPHVLQQIPYAPGDRLWVRETWAVGNIYDSTAPRDINPEGKPGWCGIRYAATDHRIGIKDRPSIHMPRWASRLTLIVTDVRVQRLQEISEDDARAEGVQKQFYEGDNPAYRGDFGWRDYRDHPHNIAPFRRAVQSFESLWDSLNAKRSYGWDVNPWVCAVTFTVHRMNIDQLEAA